MEYKTITHNELKVFNDQVTELLNNGWELYGSPYAMGYYHCQALIKGGDNNEKHSETAR